ncbi:MAG: AMP-binding protein [Oscillospiraceae bacterium]|nr:AMP-binding protein [Oscillospiraceae bacterium]
MNMTFSGWLEGLSDAYGVRPAIISTGALNYRELLYHSRHCADMLHKAGVHKGDKVVLWGNNSTEWVISFFGIIMAGGVAVLMNYGLNAAEVAALVKMTESGWGIIGDNKLSLDNMACAVDALTDGGVSSEHIFMMDELCGMSYPDTDSPVQSAGYEWMACGHEPKDTQVLIFTTGTTSMPKAVQLSSYSILNNVLSGSNILKDDMTESICDALPLFHSYGLTMMMIWLNNGGRVYLPPKIKPQAVFDIIYQNEVSAAATVGAIYSGLLQLPGFDEKIAGKLKTCFVGGGATTPTELMRTETCLKGGKMLIAYGQTECSPLISINTGSDPLERRAVSVGHILPGVDVRIWREDIGFLPCGEIGEIVVKGPNTMNGYLGLSEEEQPFDGDGWLHTGDLGLIDEFGLLRLAGRIKDIIIRNGENISPLEIENAVMEFPEVSAAKVFGAPHSIWGESVEACIVSQGDELCEDSLRDQLKKKLSSYKIPSHFFRFSSFPLNTNGKIDQRSLKAQMLERLRKVYISNALNEGMTVLSAKTGNRRNTITPVCDMVQGFIEQMGYETRQINRIRLAVEEMLTERIENAYDENGMITLDVILLPDRLRIRFTDSGRKYRLDDADASISAKIILANVDAYGSSVSSSELQGIDLDWQYAEGFDVRSFLMK